MVVVFLLLLLYFYYAINYVQSIWSDLFAIYASDLYRSEYSNNSSCDFRYVMNNMCLFIVMLLVTLCKRIYRMVYTDLHSVNCLCSGIVSNLWYSVIYY